MVRVRRGAKAARRHRLIVVATAGLTVGGIGATAGLLVCALVLRLILHGVSGQVQTVVMLVGTTAGAYLASRAAAPTIFRALPALPPAKGERSAMSNRHVQIGEVRLRDDRYLRKVLRTLLDAHVAAGEVSWGRRR